MTEPLLIPEGLSKGTMPGACRSGGDNKGRLVHLIDNPDNRPVHLLGQALCGAMPHFDWSENLPATERICSRCQRKLARRTELIRAARAEAARLASGMSF